MEVQVWKWALEALERGPKSGYSSWNQGCTATGADCILVVISQAQMTP
jgi:hypothetical protein